MPCVESGVELMDEQLMAVHDAFYHAVGDKSNHEQAR